MLSHVIPCYQYPCPISAPTWSTDPRGSPSCAKTQRHFAQGVGWAGSHQSHIRPLAQFHVHHQIWWDIFVSWACTVTLWHYRNSTTASGRTGTDFCHCFGIWSRIRHLGIEWDRIANWIRDFNILQQLNVYPFGWALYGFVIAHRSAAWWSTIVPSVPIRFDGFSMFQLSRMQSKLNVWKKNGQSVVCHLSPYLSTSPWSPNHPICCLYPSSVLHPPNLGDPVVIFWREKASWDLSRRGVRVEQVTLPKLLYDLCRDRL